MLKEGERSEDLEYKGLRIIQHPDGYCFTSDSVLLANLCRVREKDTVCELCAGSGVVSILVSAKYSPVKVVGVELQSRLADMAERSVLLNGMSDKVEIVCAPVQGIEKRLGSGVFDVVLCNPPYLFAEKKEEYTEDEICKSEACLTLDEMIRAASALLRFGGNFYMVYKAFRLADAIETMRKYKLEPKSILPIQPKASKDVDAFIVEGKKGGKTSLRFLAPVVVYDEEGNFTEMGRRIYGK